MVIEVTGSADHDLAAFVDVHAGIETAYLGLGGVAEDHDTLEVKDVGRGVAVTAGDILDIYCRCRAVDLEA